MTGAVIKRSANRDLGDRRVRLRLTGRLYECSAGV